MKNLPRPVRDIAAAVACAEFGRADSSGAAQRVGISAAVATPSAIYSAEGPSF